VALRRQYALAQSIGGGERFRLENPIRVAVDRDEAQPIVSKRDLNHKVLAVATIE
jgi:hypothetical protein